MLSVKPNKPKRFRIKTKCAGSFVYFIQKEDGPIKIGLSVNPQARLASLQSGSPEPLRLLGCVPGDRVVEAQLHQRFAQYRLLGEWFEPHQDILDYIRGRKWPR